MKKVMKSVALALALSLTLTSCSSVSPKIGTTDEPAKVETASKNLNESAIDDTVANVATVGVLLFTILPIAALIVAVAAED